jgi:hypothetical protein
MAVVVRAVIPCTAAIPAFPTVVVVVLLTLLVDVTVSAVSLRVNALTVATVSTEGLGLR